MKNIKQKILIFIIGIVIFFVYPSFALAEIVISEIQILPTENRFVELFNNGDSDVELTGFYLQRKTPSSDAFSSMVSSTNFEGRTIKAGDYFVISKSSNVLNSFVFDKLTITESNQIVLKNNKQQVVSSVSLDGFPGCNLCISNPPESKSVSLVGSQWQVTTPNPLSVFSNSDSVSENKENEKISSSSSSSSTSSSFVDSSKNKNKIIYNPNIITKIEAPSVVVAGIPFEVKQKTIGHKNEFINFGKFVWNFGDGNQNILDYSGPFFYKYENAGDYLMSLSYYDTKLTTSKDAYDRKNIKVVSPGVKILSVGEGDKPYVEIKNDTGYEVELNGWVIEGVSRVFKIPDGTILLSGKTIKIPYSATNFSSEDVLFLQIKDSTGLVFSTYPDLKKNNRSLSLSEKQKNYNFKYEESDLKTKEDPVSLSDQDEPVNLNNLAQALNKENQKNKPNQNILSYFVFVFIVVAGALSIYSFSKKEHKENSSEDIKIME